MVQAKPRFQSIEDYTALTTSELPECRFELVNGEIIEMGAENLQNIRIATLLIVTLARFVAFHLIHRGTEVEVTSDYVTCREPDLMVITPETDAAMAADRRSLITLSMPNPALVVEVVSPGDEQDANYQRDYVEKPQEYAARGIPEYWRIDPSRFVVTVLQLEVGQYRSTTYQGDERIVSPTFPALTLTAEQILNAGQ
jgi:Uma2 family endonuclease